MSLLLDALKKAAQEKQNQKQGVASNSSVEDKQVDLDSSEERVDNDQENAADLELVPITNEPLDGSDVENDVSGDDLDEPLEPASDSTDVTNSASDAHEISAESRLSDNELNEYLQDSVEPGNERRGNRSTFAFERDDLSLESDTEDLRFLSTLLEERKAEYLQQRSDSPSQAIRMLVRKLARDKNIRIFAFLGLAIGVFIVGGIFVYHYLDSLNQSEFIAVAPIPETSTQEPTTAVTQSVTDPDLLAEREQYSASGQNTEPADSAVIDTPTEPTVTPPASVAKKTGQPSGQSRQARPKQQRKIVREPLRDMVMRAYTSYQAGDLQTAAVEYQRVLRRSPNNRDSLLGMAAIYTTRGEWARARETYQQLLRLNPRDDIALAGTAAIKQRSGKISVSDADYSRIKLALEEQPKSAQLHFALGSIHAGQRRWPDAQKAYFDAYRLASDNPDYAYNLAVSLEHIGQRQAAIRYYREAVALAGKSNAHFEVARIEKRIQWLLGTQ